MLGTAPSYSVSLRKPRGEFTAPQRSATRLRFGTLHHRSGRQSLRLLLTSPDQQENHAVKVCSIENQHIRLLESQAVVLLILVQLLVRLVLVRDLAPPRGLAPE